MSSQTLPKGVLVRSSSSLKEIILRRREHSNMLASAAKRRDKLGDVSGARYYQNMVETTDRNTEALFVAFGALGS